MALTHGKSWNGPCRKKFPHFAVNTDTCWELLSSYRAGYIITEYHGGYRWTYNCGYSVKSGGEQLQIQYSDAFVLWPLSLLKKHLSKNIFPHWNERKYHLSISATPKHQQNGVYSLFSSFWIARFSQ